MTKFGMYPGNDWTGSLASLGKEVANAADIELHLGRSVTVQRRYRTWPAVGVDGVLLDAQSKGRTPYTEIAPDCTDATWASIASGKEDVYIDRMGAAYKAWWTGAEPYYFVFQHEPDTESRACGSSTDFKLAFGRWVSRWKAIGVPCKYVFNLNGDFRSASRAAKWLPDPSSYDIVGADGYNKGPVAGAKWRSFEDIFSYSHQFAQSVHKPLCIGEVGCAENPNDTTGANSKAQWFTDMGKTAHDWNLEFFCYTHRVAKQDYTVTTSPAATDAFIAMSKTFV